MQYWKERPSYPYACFARVNDNEEVVEFPVETIKIMEMAPGVDIAILLEKPPEGYVPVWTINRAPVATNPLTEVVTVPPVKTSAGYWTMNWEIRPLSVEATDALLAEVRAQKNAEINASRLAANNHFFPLRDKEIACDPLSRSDIDGVNGMVNLNGGFPAGWVGGWKCRDNTYVPITTIEHWKELYKAMFDQGQINFAHSQALKNMLTSVNTYDELIAISWGTATGYPATPLP